MTITWSPFAIERVSEIASYIAQDNPHAAEAWVEQIFEAVERLAEFPESGRMVPGIADPSFREIISGNYRVIHHVGGMEVQILTVRHGKQILPTEDLDQRRELNWSGRRDLPTHDESDALPGLWIQGGVTKRDLSPASSCDFPGYDVEVYWGDGQGVDHWKNSLKTICESY
jgi:plasmid stabilization system protein ParE